MQAARRHLEDALIMRTVSGKMIRGLLFLFIAALVQGCATTGGPADTDPWEGFNRDAFAFNESLDRDVMRPIAQGYEKVTPSFVRTGVNNFFGNIADAWTGVNQLLQGKPREAISDMGRVILNTTAGVLGLWDVASAVGVEKHEEDFGQTLAAWGVPSGPYLVLPFFGPSSARDGPALFVNPAWSSYKGAFSSEPAYWATLDLDAVRIRANFLPVEKLLDEAAIDKYAFIRDAWRQRRRNQVYDGNPPAEPED
jgi:phospholipid-binding lipoprotein MlaA